jgi:uncharacterized protein (DUF2384 family)
MTDRQASTPAEEARLTPREVVELAASIYTRPGVGVWLLGANGLLDGKRPVDLLDTDAGRARLAAQLHAMGEGVFV